MLKNNATYEEGPSGRPLPLGATNVSVVERAPTAKLSPDWVVVEYVMCRSLLMVWGVPPLVLSIKCFMMRGHVLVSPRC